MNTTDPSGMGHPACTDVDKCCPNHKDDCCNGVTDCPCDPCEHALVGAVHAGLQGSGGIGLFFSFTEIVGIVVTYRYRGMAHDTIS